MRGAPHIDRGFTLIELMIVAAIGSILASIAIPQFMSFRGRAQQAEAKANLGSVFKTQKALLGERNSYSDNLATLGWQPEGELHYIIGFTSDSTPASSGLNDTAELASVTAISTRAMVHRFGLPLTEADLPTSPVSQTAFTIGAAGNIDGDADLDRWTLNDANVLEAVTPDVE